MESTAANAAKEHHHPEWSNVRTMVVGDKLEVTMAGVQPGLC
jgi:pterin-4a-carbinolamine dehydratase